MAPRCFYSLSFPRWAFLVSFGLIVVLVVAIALTQPDNSSFLWILVLLWIIFSYLGFMAWLVVAYLAHLNSIVAHNDEENPD